MYAWRRFWAHCQVYKRYVYSYGLVCPYTVFFSPLSHLTDVWDPHVSGFFNLPPSLSSHALSPGRAKPGPAAEARRTAGAAIIPCSPRATPPPAPRPVPCSPSRRPLSSSPAPPAADPGPGQRATGRAPPCWEVANRTASHRVGGSHASPRVGRPSGLAAARPEGGEVSRLSAPPPLLHPVSSPGSPSPSDALLYLPPLWSR
jgi:hypothetical protein